MRSPNVISLIPFVLALGLGCSARTAVPERPSIDDLRRRAEARPRDPEAQRELAEAELLAGDGDPARARAVIERAKSLALRDPRLHLLDGLELYHHGELSGALDAFLATLEHAHASARDEAPIVAEVAASSLEDLIDLVPGFSTKVRSVVERFVSDPGHLGEPARQMLARLAIELAYRRGDLDAVQAFNDRAGCIRDWTVAGPFGPHALLGFDESYPPEAKGPLAREYDLGEGRGIRPTRAHRSRGCAVHLGEGPLALGGTTYAKTTIDVAEGGLHSLRLDTPNAVELFVDGRSIVRLDLRKRATPRVTFHRLELPAGRHELTVKVSTRHPNPVVGVALSRPVEPASDDATIRGPLGAYLRAARSVARGDMESAKVALDEYGEESTSAVFLTVRAAVMLADALRPPDVRRDESRALLRKAAARDPLAWYPEVQLARLAAAEGRVAEGIASLREAEARWPEVLAIPLALADLLVQRGWDIEAEEASDRAYARAPDSCPAVRIALSTAQRRERVKDADRLSDALVACDARSDARLTSLVAKRRWPDAKKEFDRLVSLEPPQLRAHWIARELQIASGAGDEQAIENLSKELGALRPLSESPPLTAADRALAGGAIEEARRVLDAALMREPAAMANLRWVRRALGGDDSIDRFRTDGAKAIRDFEASGRTYDAPQILVLDYTVTRVFSDGSSFELTHNIFRVNSQEAVDEHGEFAIPEGARILTLHTVKADGRRLEPDLIEGKETISLPSLAPGDYVEYEHVKLLDSPPVFPSGARGSRFYFRSFEVPFDRSEFVLAVPSSITPLFDPRGNAPPPETRNEDDLRIYRWQVRGSEPLTSEPLSISTREWVPSIDWGIGASWERFVDGLRDILADRDLFDREAKELAVRIAGTSTDTTTKARRLYHWVLANVENNDDFTGLAPAMLAQRTGNRARVLRYLLELAGIRAELILARHLGSDQTPSELADDETYPQLLVRIHGEKSPIFVATAERGTPFGYLSPLLSGQEALVLAKGAPRIHLPRARRGQDRRSVEVDVTLAREGMAEVQVFETYRGSGAVAFRKELEGVPDAVLEQRFEEEYVGRIVSGARLRGLTIEHRREADAPLVLRYAFEVPAFGHREGGKLIVPPFFSSNLSSLFARTARRTTTMLVPGFDTELTLRVRAPDAKRILAPNLRTLRGPGDARFGVRSKRIDGGIQIERVVRVPTMRVTPSEYPRFARFCRAADEAEARDLAFEF